jgi:hypothetical protein
MLNLSSAFYSSKNMTSNVTFGARGGRSPAGEEKKTRHTISVKPDAWKQCVKKATALQYGSVSAMLEDLGMCQRYVTAFNAKEKLTPDEQKSLEVYQSRINSIMAPPPEQFTLVVPELVDPQN